MAAPRYYERLLTVGAVFIVFFVVMIIVLPVIKPFIGYDTRNGMLLASVIQAVILFIVPSFLSGYFINRRPLSYLTLNKAPSWISILGVVLAYLISLPALNQLIYWNAHISFPESLAVWGETMRAMEDTANEAAHRMMDVTSFGSLVVNLLVIALVTAFGEELFFRGTLQRTAGSNGMHHTAIWVVALLFSTMHLQIFGFVPRLILGAWFGYIFYWTGSIYVPIIAHFINNGVVVVCTWLNARGGSYDFDNFGVAEYGFPLAAFVSAVAIVIFLTYFRKFFFDTSYEINKENEDIEYV